MGNPFFNPGNRNQNYQPNSPMGNMQNMFSQFQQFRNNFRGDPRQQVQDLLNSGCGWRLLECLRYGKYSGPERMLLHDCRREYV